MWSMIKAQVAEGSCGCARWDGKKATKGEIKISEGVQPLRLTKESVVKRDHQLIIVDYEAWLLHALTKRVKIWIWSISNLGMNTIIYIRNFAQLTKICHASFLDLWCLLFCTCCSLLTEWLEFKTNKSLEGYHFFVLSWASNLHCFCFRSTFFVFWYL